MSSRRVGRLVASAVLLAGPTALAFFTGGYFSPARAWAGLGAWVLVGIALLLAERRSAGLRLSRPATVAVAGLALLGAWTMASILWAPVAGSAYGAAQITFLYLGALIAAALLLRGRCAGSAVEPALAAGTLIVVGYGLSERLLPGLLTFSRSVTAQGRLEQPLTYWNAMGELAAIGLVLAVRLAGDARRRLALRAAAAAAVPVLAVGLYISFSRGALFAAVAGLITLLVVAPQRSEWESFGLTVIAAVVACAVTAPLRGVTNLSGRPGTRETQGLIVLIVLVVLAAALAYGQVRLARRPARMIALPRRTGWVAGAVVCAGLALAIALGAKEQSGVPLSGGANRLVTLQSNRYAYWRVALRAFGHDPLIGVGAGGWSVWWLRDRPYGDGARDAHSLELQTLAELGLVGAVLLLAFLVGVGGAARRAHLIDPAAAAGPIAGCVVWLAHSPLDWDWQMPALTLIALMLAGRLAALSSQPVLAARVLSKPRPEPHTI